MFIDKIVLFQCATPSGSYEIANIIFYKHVILSGLKHYRRTSSVMGIIKIKQSKMTILIAGSENKKPNKLNYTGLLRASQ